MQHLTETKTRGHKDHNKLGFSYRIHLHKKDSCALRK